MKDYAKLPQTFCYPVDVDITNLGYNADMEVKVCQHAINDFDEEDETKINKEVKRYVFKKKIEDKNDYYTSNKDVKPEKVTEYRKTSEAEGFGVRKPAATLKKAHSVQTTKNNIKSKQIDENVNYTNFKNFDIVSICNLTSKTKTFDQKIK